MENHQPCLADVQAWLPNELQSLDGWRKHVPPLRIPWRAAYQSFVVNGLHRLVTTRDGHIRDRENRPAYFLDVNSSTSLKSPESIADKISRHLRKVFAQGREDPHLPKGVPPDILDRQQELAKMNVDEFLLYFMSHMEDIARCRILCNYNSDLEDLDRILKDDKHLAKHGRLRADLRSDKRLESGYPFTKGAHRAVHEYFEVKLPEGAPAVLVEVQLMTFLQQAWDMKQHVLYEIKRSLPHDSSATLTEQQSKLRLALDRFHALSGLLMIADEFADNTWREFKEKS